MQAWQFGVHTLFLGEDGEGHESNIELALTATSPLLPVRGENNCALRINEKIWA